MAGGVPETAAPIAAAGCRRATVAIARRRLLRSCRHHPGDHAQFFDAQVFGMMAQRIKVDFQPDRRAAGLSDRSGQRHLLCAGRHSDGEAGGHLSAQDRARLRNRRDRRHHRTGWTGAELQAAVLQPHAGGRRRLGACAGSVFDARRLFPACEIAARHRLSAAGLYRRQCARHLSWRTADQPGLRLAGQPLDGAYHARLAVDLDDGGRARAVDLPAAAAGEGARAARYGSARQAVAGDGGAARDLGAQGRSTCRCSSVLRSAPHKLSAYRPGARHS